MLHLGPDLCLPVVRFAQHAEGAALTLVWPDGEWVKTGGASSVTEFFTAVNTLLDQLLNLQKQGVFHGRIALDIVLFGADFKKLSSLDWHALHLCGLALDGGPPSAAAAAALRVRHWRSVVRCRQAQVENNLQTLSILKTLLAPLQQEFCSKSERGDLVEHEELHGFSDVSFLHELIVKPGQTEDNLSRKMSLSDLRRQLEVFLCHWRLSTSTTSCVISPEPKPFRVTKVMPLSRHERILPLLHLLQPSKSFSESSVGEVAACSTAAVIREVPYPNTLARGALFHLVRWERAFESWLGVLVEEDQVAVKQIHRAQFQSFREQLNGLDGGILQIKAVLRGWSSLRKPSQAQWLLNSLNNILESVITLFCVFFRDLVVFCVELCFYAPVRCLYGYLEQVFISLLINACQSVQRREGDDLAPGQVTLSIDDHDGMQSVGIQDIGVGIETAAALSPVIHDETDLIPSGRGFGLVIRRHFLQRQGGTLILTGQPGCGALVQVMLLKPAPDMRPVGVRDSAATPDFCLP